MILESLDSSKVSLRDLQPPERKIGTDILSCIPDSVWARLSEYSRHGINNYYDLFSPGLFLARISGVTIPGTRTFYDSIKHDIDERIDDLVSETLNFEIKEIDSARHVFSLGFFLKLAFPSENSLQPEFADVAKREIEENPENNTFYQQYSLWAKMLFPNIDLTLSKDAWKSSYQTFAINPTHPQSLQIASSFKILFPHESQLLLPTSGIFQSARKEMIESFEDTNRKVDFNSLFYLTVISSSKAYINENGLQLEFSPPPPTIGKKLIPNERKF